MRAVDKDENEHEKYSIHSLKRGASPPKKNNSVTSDEKIDVFVRNWVKDNPLIMLLFLDPSGFYVSVFLVFF